MWVGVCEAVSCQKLCKWDFLHYLFWHFLGRRPHTQYTFLDEKIHQHFLHPSPLLLHCQYQKRVQMKSFWRLDHFSNSCCEWAIEVDDERNQTLGINQIIFSKSPNDIKNLPVAPTFGSIVPNLSMTCWPMVEIQAKIVRRENPSIFPPRPTFNRELGLGGDI